MVPNFSPKIQVIGKGSVLTAPHEVRDEAWRILNLVYSDYIIEKRGGVGTQITVTPNPGYGAGDAFSLLATATYLATTSFENVWRTSQSSFMAEIKKEFPCDVEVKRSVVVFLVNRYIQDAATKNLKSAYENGFQGLHYRETVLETWLDEVVECHRRYKDKHGKKSPREASDVEVFTFALKQGRSINSQVKFIKDYVLIRIKRFEDSFSTVDLPDREEYTHLLKLIIDQVQKAKAIHNAFLHSDETFNGLLREIRLATPPAPPAPIIKK